MCQYETHAGCTWASLLQVSDTAVCYLPDYWHYPWLNELRTLSPLVIRWSPVCLYVCTLSSAVTASFGFFRFTEVWICQSWDCVSECSITNTTHFSLRNIIISSFISQLCMVWVLRLNKTSLWCCFSTTRSIPSCSEVYCLFQSSVRQLTFRCLLQQLNILVFGVEAPT